MNEKEEKHKIVRIRGGGWEQGKRVTQNCFQCNFSTSDQLRSLNMQHVLEMESLQFESRCIAHSAAFGSNELCRHVEKLNATLDLPTSLTIPLFLSCLTALAVHAQSYLFSGKTVYTIKIFIRTKQALNGMCFYNYTLSLSNLWF